MENVRAKLSFEANRGSRCLHRHESPSLSRFRPFSSSLPPSPDLLAKLHGSKDGRELPLRIVQAVTKAVRERLHFRSVFPSRRSHKFAIVHKVFGASNVSKMLQELPVHQRGDAASSLVYEANARVRDPVYGCVGAISYLQNQVAQLQMQLAMAQAEILCVQMQQETPFAREQKIGIDDDDDDDKHFMLQHSGFSHGVNQFMSFSSPGTNVVQEPLKRESLWA
uniref:LOB domain-containing protein n=1 Tax=Ananas comosus var. bracteatus TaxID=296719 RepID=A0A6V7NGB3_ANACO|nr:unnamed protein product [Ananas comosus var. bracteatus]